MDYSQVAVWGGFLGGSILAVRDLHDRRIPNAVVYPLLLFALILFIARLAGNPDWSMALEFLGGFLVFGGLWLVIFAIGGCGGGDVKLMAANGALLGLSLGLLHMLFALVAAVSYLALLVLMRLVLRVAPTLEGLRGVVDRHTARDTARAVEPRPAGQASIAIPFAVPAALGYVPLIAGLYGFQHGWAP